MRAYDMDGNPIDDTSEAALLLNKPERQIGRDQVGDVFVSTVFLVLDHNWMGEGPPILWETMIFGGDEDGYQRRYATREEAWQGHRAVCKLVFGPDYEPIEDAEYTEIAGELPPAGD